MIDAAVLHVLASAKAYAALVGSLLTLVVAVNPDAVPSWVPYVIAVCTALATWAIPNTPPTNPTDAPAATNGDLGTIS